MKKLQNYFNDFLPQSYREFRLSAGDYSANKGVVASLLRVCAETEEVSAIQLAFERIIGKPEKVVIIKRTLVRTVYPDATGKLMQPPVVDRVEDETTAVSVTENDELATVDLKDTPGAILQAALDEIGEGLSQKVFDILDDKDSYTVATVIVANLYAIAMNGNNIGAIKLLFNYLDGSVADIIRIDGEDTLLLESYADVAPYEAVQGDDGIYYVETEAVK